jgi:hypothetical protein
MSGVLSFLRFGRQAWLSLADQMDGALAPSETGPALMSQRGNTTSESEEFCFVIFGTD